MTVSIDGESVVLRSKKQRLILAVLVVAGGEVRSRDALIDALWPDGAPGQVDTNLNSYISGLRRALEPDLSRTSDSMLRTHPSGYSLDIDRERVDLFRFEDAIRESEQATDADSIEALLSGALALVRGAPLADFLYDESLVSEASRLEELVQETRERQLELALGRGEHRRLVSLLSPLVADQPLRENLRVLYMLALYRSGRQAEALAVFQKGREILIEELGLEPGPALTNLEARILAQDPGLSLPESVPEAGQTSAEPDQVSGPDETARDRSPAAVSTEALPPKAVSPEIVGRRHELTTLRRGLSSAVGGSGSVALLCGPAGIGKSVLVRELLTAAREVPTVAATVGNATRSGGPYGVWAQAMTRFLDSPQGIGAFSAVPDRLRMATLRVFPSIAADLGLPEPDPINDLASATSLIESLVETTSKLVAAAPVVCVVEDLHDADAASLEFFARLGERIAELPRLFLVGTYRDDALDSSSELRDMVGRVVGRAGVTRLVVQGFDPEDAHEMLEPIVGAVDHLTVGLLVERTGGNPLFLSELAKNAVAQGLELSYDVPVTEDLAHAIRRRIAMLPERVVDVLEVASCAEGSISASVDAEVLGWSINDVEDAYDEAIVAGVLREDPDVRGNVRFTHALVRDALYEGISPRKAGRIHAALARAIESDAGPLVDRFAAVLARHYKLGSRCSEEAAEWLGRAGDNAAARFDHDEAFAHRRDRVELFESEFTDAQQLVSARLDLARSARLIGEVEVAEQRYLEAFAEARRRSDIAGQARVALDFSEQVGGEEARTWWQPGQVALDALDEVLAHAEQLDDVLQARLLMRRACDGNDLPDDERLAMAERALAIARSSGDEDLEVELAGNAILVRWGGEPADALLLACEDVLARARDRGLASVELTTLRWMVGLCLASGDGRAAEERADELFRRGALLGVPPIADGSFAVPPMLSIIRGEFGAAEDRYATMGLGLPKRSGGEVVRLLGEAYMAWQRDESSSWADVLELAAGEGTLSMALLAVLLRAESGDLPRARILLDRIRPHELRRAESRVYLGVLPWLLGRIGPLLDDDDLSSLAVELLEPMAGGLVLPGPCLNAAGSPDLARAVALVHLKRADDAEAALDLCTPTLEGIEAHPWLLDALLQRGHIAALRGDVQHATSLFSEVAERGTTLGLKRLVRQSETALRAH